MQGGAGVESGVLREVLQLIFTVTTLHENEPLPILEKIARHQRIWGYYFDFDAAENAILTNYSDLFEEGYYNHAVIERVQPGICTAPAEQMQWYFADYSEVKPRRGFL